jgi:hypothetical protein
MPDEDTLAGILASSPGFTREMWLTHAPEYLVPLRDVAERDAQNPHDPNGIPRDNWSREPFDRWQANQGVSGRVIFPAGKPAPYWHDGGSVALVTDASGERWHFGSWQIGRGEHGVFRLATRAERMAELRRLGTWLTGDKRLRVHLDDDGLWSEPNPGRDGPPR